MQFVQYLIAGERRIGINIAYPSFFVKLRSLSQLSLPYTFSVLFIHVYMFDDTECFQFIYIVIVVYIQIYLPEFLD